MKGVKESAFQRFLPCGSVAVVAVIALLGYAASQTTLTVQFQGSGTQMTLDEASALASVDLGRDTGLTDADIANFTTIGENDFLGCFATPMVDLQSTLVLGTGIDCLRVTPVEAAHNFRPYPFSPSLKAPW